MKKNNLIILFLFVFSGYAFAQVNPTSQLPKDSTVRYGKLSNGLTYYIQHNNKPEKRAEFYLVTNVGAIQETPAQDGLAHFLEHMALNGSKNLPGKMMLDYFRTIGVEFGRNINAGTGVEITQYYLNNIPLTRPGILDTALLVLHDYSGFVTNDPVEIDKERGVIIEEWRTRRSADWRMKEKNFTYMFKGSKYATCTLIGSKENLETFDPVELEKFYKTWYRPDLQAVIIVGDIDVNDIEKRITDLFADIPARENPQPKEVHIIPDNVEPIVGIVTDKEATSTVVNVFFKSQPLPKEYRVLGIGYLNNMLESIISDMVNERLSDISKSPNSPFLFAQAGFGALSTTCNAFMGIIATKDSEGVSGFKALMTEFEKMKRYGFTSDEYERAKTNLLRGLEKSKDEAESRKNSELVGNLVNDFIFGYPYLTPEFEYELAKGYCSVIPIDQINGITKQMDFSKNCVITYNSMEKEGLTHPTEKDFTDVMSSLSSLEISAPVQETINEPLLDESKLTGSKVTTVKNGPFGATEWILANGIKVIVKKTDYKKDEVLIKMFNEGGRSLVATEDLPSIDETLYATYQSLSGISTFPSTKLTKMLSGKMVAMSPFINSKEHGIKGSASPKDLETFLQLTYLYYTDPRFEESEFQPGLDQIKTVIGNIVKQPNYMFQKEIIETLYNSPRMTIIGQDVLDKFNYATMEKVVRNIFSDASGATVEIVGDFDQEQLKGMVEKYIGSLPTAKKPTSIMTNVDYVKNMATNKFAADMTTEKTSVGLLYSGISKFGMKELVQADALKYILDVVYTESIREEEGGTYGVSVSYIAEKFPVENILLQIVFDTDPAKADNLIEIAKKGLFDISKQGPTEAQLQDVKKNLLKNLPENRIKNSYWLNNLTYQYKYGIDRDSDYENIVNSITVKDIRNFTKKILRQGNLVEVVMTPKQK